MLRFLPPAIGIGLALLACGSPPASVAPPPPPPPEPPSDLSFDPVDAEPPPLERHLPIQAGAYRLRMTAACPTQERTAKGRLTLKRISASELPVGGGGRAAAGSEVASGELLLWGQTDLDVESLEACLSARPRGSPSTKREPIHPSVLVEVLQWNGQSQRQVLLVSADPKGVKGRRASAGAGIAMWVEQSDEGHLAGVWCRWEVMNQGEGRWEADLVKADPK
jgi:hypothetical protein